MGFFIHAAKMEISMSPIEEKIQVYLFGSLQNESEKLSKGHTTLTLKSPSTLIAIMKRIGIPRVKVQIAFVNHRAVRIDCVINPGDRVSFFPREYAIFPDWYGYRL